MKQPIKSEILRQEAISILQDILLDYGSFPKNSWVGGETGFPSDKGYNYSFLYDLSLENGRGVNWQLHTSIKGEVYPKQAWYEIMKLKEAIDEKKSHYALLIAEFISPRVATMCDESGVGYLDLSGNCKIKFGGLWIERSGRPRKYKASRTAKSLFTVKASRLIRVLLKAPIKPYLVKELSEQAQVSLGQVSKVRKLLMDQDLVEETESGVRVKNRDELIDLWVQADDFYKRVEEKEYSLLSSPQTLAEKLLSHNKESPLFTMNYAASLRVAHNVVNSVAVYLPKFPDEQLLATLKAREVSKGSGNLRVFIPHDIDALKIDSQTINGIPLVSDLQLYLDLQDGEQNGKEQAEALKKLDDFNVTQCN